jgi:uncharacterized protein YkwD
MAIGKNRQKLIDFIRKLILSALFSIGLLFIVLLIPSFAKHNASQTSIEFETGTRVSRPKPETYAELSSGTTSTIFVWEQLNLPSEVSDEVITDFSVHPEDANTVYLAGSFGLYKSTDAGESWLKVSPNILNIVSRIVIAPDNPQRIYAKSWALFRSEDGGKTWNQIPSPPSYCDLEVAPSDPNRLYAPSCYGDDAPALYRSDDGGQNWITPTDNFTQTLSNLAVSPIDSDLLIVSTYQQSIYRSTDGGSHWDMLPTLENKGFREFVFDPNPPHTLYTGSWSGLIRSRDAGQTWEDSRSLQNFISILVSPFEENSVFGGYSYGSTYWHFIDKGETWQASRWNTPNEVDKLYRSQYDSRLIYARNADGFWRYSARINHQPYEIFLPLVRRESSAPLAHVDAQRALDQANIYRSRVNTVPLRLHPAIIRAAENHAKYYMLNYQEQSAWEYGPHGEVEGYAGYTGKAPSERMLYAGLPTEFPWGGGSEVMHYIGDPVESVDGWMSSVYHRIIVLDPSVNYAGYGNGKSEDTAVDVMDFGWGSLESGSWYPVLSAYPLAYPTDGQLDVPPEWGGGEYPDPLPPGAARPVGYPFTLQGVGGKLQVDKAEFQDSNGNHVSFHPNPPDCPTFNCFALITTEPLVPNTKYVVTVQGNVSGIPFDRMWTFKTGESTKTTSRSERQIIGPTWPK